MDPVSQHSAAPVPLHVLQGLQDVFALGLQPDLSLFSHAWPQDFDPAGGLGTGQLNSLLPLPRLPVLDPASSSSGSVPSGASSSKRTAPSWICPFDSSARTWTSSSSCFHHVERVHLQCGDDESTISSWLASARRCVCPICRLLVPLGRECRACHRRPNLPIPASTTLGPDVPAADSSLEDTLWLQVIQHSLPVVRSLPLGCRDLFFSQLAAELERIGPSADPSSVYRMAAFCRIVLQPLGRGGRRHCRQAVAVINGRIARWTSGQQAALVREYLAQALRPKNVRAVIDGWRLTDHMQMKRATKDINMHGWHALHAYGHFFLMAAGVKYL